MPDVIVVGGGPVGSRVAAGLARAGHSVVVLEKQPTPGHKACCTGIVSLECARAFSIDASCILSNLSGATLFPPSAEAIRLYRGRQEASVLDRAVFDARLAEEAQRAGAEYRFSWRVCHLSLEPDRVVARAICRGKEVAAEARALVIASGFSRGAEGVGLGWKGDFALGAQAEVETTVSETEVYFGRGIAPGFFAWLVPVAGGRGRVGLLTRSRPGQYLASFMSWLEGRGKIIAGKARVSYGVVPLSPIRRSYGQRVLVVGDAAGQVKPTTGGGLYYGLLGADMAVSTLRQALERGDLSARALAPYEKAWRKKLGHELKTGRWSRGLFERLDDARLDQAFSVARSAGIVDALLKGPDLSFDWHSHALLKLLRYRAIAAITGKSQIDLKAAND